MLDKIRIVLVNTTHPGNIGAAARAMKNMGLSELCLVEPKLFPHPDAIARSSRADDILETALVVESLEEAVADCQLVVGTSARGRHIPWPIVNPRELSAQVSERLSKTPDDFKVAILFGREDRGLTNDELQKCHYHVHIPSNPDYSSLNLATAVQVLSYEVRMASLADAEGNLPSLQEWDQPPVPADDLENFHVHLAETMADLGFYDPENPKQLLTRMRRLFNRQRMDKMEVSILRGLLSSVQRIINK